jgi:hypothetical protein
MIKDVMEVIRSINKNKENGEKVMILTDMKKTKGTYKIRNEGNGKGRKVYAQQRDWRQIENMEEMGKKMTKDGGNVDME